MSVLGTIAVGFDGSPPAEAAVRWALSLAAQTGANVVVVHAVGLLEHPRSADTAVLLEGKITELTTEAELDPQRVRWLIADGDPSSVLSRSAQAPVSADLLVVGSHGHGGREGLPLGSTSHELAEAAPVPLVIVR